MGGRDVCCVVGCSNRRSVAKMPYHRIPKKPEGRRKSWIKATGRQCHGKNKFILTLYTRVWGAHFVNGVKSDNLHIVDYIPTQKLPATITTPGQPSQPRLTATSTKARVYREAVETGIKAKPIRYSARRKLVINEFKTTPHKCKKADQVISVFKLTLLKLKLDII
ncbi:hypothetical protein MAR_021570 [Mya arenaria]|uniref:THAP-type domain-containing protein n=1 Tax=Mya arenaria TaxID=6604 RepID=A0ABY7EBD8_MYAAR|nr:hypothetical protein MAR_021570 [Mya arenaria]